ncbi:peroxisomal carnitine O-octanoyltransferase-like isoform X1 [Branchiostoma floridae x Branchiostoma japonicum]
MDLTTIDNLLSTVAETLRHLAGIVGISRKVGQFSNAVWFATSAEALQKYKFKWIPERLHRMVLQFALKALGERTWQHQDTLPPLPVPDLQHTMDRYLESVKPHVTAEEYKRAEEAVRQFLDGDGPELHRQLLDRASTRKNWLEDWWLEFAYLRFRKPLPLNLNIAGSGPYFEHGWPPQEGTTLERGALFIYYLLQFWKLLRTEQLPVDRLARGGTVLDMDQFRRFFCTTRVPGHDVDRLVTAFKSVSEGPCPTYITFLHNDRLFKVEVIGENDEPITPPEIQEQLKAAMRMAECEPGPGVSVLTAAEREQWAKSRDRLIELDAGNAYNLDVIEQSLFGFCFDDAFPTNHGENFAASLAGCARNRWFDKCISVLSFRSGTIATNNDHTPCDGMVHIHAAYYIDCQLKQNDCTWKGHVPDRKLPPPEELVFTVDDDILKAVKHAEQLYNNQARDLECICHHFTDYGKKFVRSFHLHPDSYVQCALQLAYYRLHGRPAPAYETGMTRQFYHGRTETVRSCTQEVVEWCKVMTEEKATVEEKKDLMVRALKKHVELMEEAKSGNGIDRHLMGLQILAMQNGLPMPAIFTDPAYVKSGGGGNYVLSTSLTGYNVTPLGNVPPMVPHGYGSFYKIDNDRFTIAMTAWKSDPETSVEKLYGNLRQAFADMKEILTTSASTNN